MLSVQQMQNNKILTFCSFIGLLFFIITVSFLIVLVSKPNYQPQLPLLMFLTPFSAFLFLFCMLRFKYEQNKKNQQLLQGYVVDQIIISQQQPQQWPQESTPYYPNLNTQQHSNLNNQPQQNVYPNLYCQPSNFNYPAQEQTNNMNTNQQFYQQYPNVPQQNTNLNNQQQSNQFY